MKQSLNAHNKHYQDDKISFLTHKKFPQLKKVENKNK